MEWTKVSGENVRMSQLAEALPNLQSEAIENLVPILNGLPIADLHDLAKAIKNRGALTLRESLMKVRDEHIRVAEWHVIDGRCEHKRYSVGSIRKARHGNIGDETWLEAWIA